MLIEVAERLGPSLDWWIHQPYARVFWAFCHLMELDRRHRWQARLERIDQAELMNLALLSPQQLPIERRSHLQAAAPIDEALEAVERGRQLARDIAAGKVLVS